MPHPGPSCHLHSLWRYALGLCHVRFVANNGLSHLVAHSINHDVERGMELRALIVHAIYVQSVKAGILIISGYGYVWGFPTASLSLSLRFPSRL